jgi:hypothetical protein
LIVYSKKNCEVQNKNKPDLQSFNKRVKSTQIKPKWVKKNGKRKHSQSTAKLWNNRTPYYMSRFKINSTKNCQKGRTEINFVLPLCLGNTVRHPQAPQVLHPKKSWMTENGRLREYPHIHMEVHEDRVFPIKLDVWMLFI